MMSFYFTLKRLIPSGLAWALPPGYMRGLIAGLAVEPGRIRDFLWGVVRESNPGTATLTQQEWFDLYGMLWNPTGAISTKQAQTLARYIATGGQDISYFQRCIDQAGFNVQIVENPPGTVERLESTLENGITVSVGPGSYYAVTYPDNDLTITENPAPESYYAGTVGNDLNVTETADTDSYIESTVGDDITVTQSVSGSEYTLNASTYSFTTDDEDKTVKFINAAGTVVMQFKIGRSSYGDGVAYRCVITGGTYQGDGTYDGGTWGFSTEDVITPGDYTLTADAAKFAEDSEGSTIRINDTDGEPLALFEVQTFESSTTATASLTSGTAPVAEVTGGAWDFSGEPILQKDTYLLECVSSYFTAGMVGGTLNVINSVGVPYFTFEITSQADGTNAGANFTGDEGAEWWLNFLMGADPSNEVNIDGGGWAMSTEEITTAAYLLASQLDAFEEADEGDTLIFIDDDGDTIAEIEIADFTDARHVSGTLSSGTAPDGWVPGGMWGPDGESTVTQNYIFNFNVVGEINTSEEAASLAALIQRLSPAHLAPIYDLDIKLNVYGAAVCGSGYCSAT